MHGVALDGPLIALSILPGSVEKQALFRKPQRGEKLWDDKGTGSRMDGSIWQAVLLDNNTVCLGHVDQSGYSAPLVYFVSIVVWCNPF